MNQVKQRRFMRDLNGILLLDKPIAITSNTALQIVKRLFAARKAGHTGSLDPLASGMLPICFGEATKFSQFLLDANKSYRVTAKLGIQTATGDAEGEIIAQCPVGNISQARVEEVLTKFRGTVAQVPSMYSALKHQGRPLYELARKGITVERPARDVQIFSLELLAQTEDTLTFEIHCSKGTYVRTLVEDIGIQLGCGAHVIELRRLQVGSYPMERMVTLATLETLAQENDYSKLDAYLLNMDSAVEGWPLVNLSEAAFYYLKRGQPVIVPHAPSHGWVRLSIGSDRFLGVGEVLDDGRIAPRRLVQETKL